jgi:riboflavin synthase
MFTGLIEKVGTLASSTARSDGMRFVIRHEPWKDALVIGESVAVQGTCLTVTSLAPGGFTCDVLKETLSRTHLAGMKAGSPVNLERALRAGDRLGGHFVTGHVDEVGQVAGLTARGADWILEIGGSAELMEQLVPKGSITVDGVSLTLAELRAKTFTVHLIPHTWENTSLRVLKRGAMVNLEADILGKHIQKQVQRKSSGGVTLEKLAAAGFG